MYTQFPAHAKRQRGEYIAIAGAGGGRKLEGTAGACNDIAESENYRTL